MNMCIHAFLIDVSCSSYGSMVRVCMLNLYLFCHVGEPWTPTRAQISAMHHARCFNTSFWETVATRISAGMLFDREHGPNMSGRTVSSWQGLACDRTNSSMMGIEAHIFELQGLSSWNMHENAGKFMKMPNLHPIPWKAPETWEVFSSLWLHVSVQDIPNVLWRLRVGVFQNSEISEASGEMSLWPSQRVWKLLLPAFSDRPKSIRVMRLETALAYDAFFSAVAGARSAVEDSHFLPSRDKNGIRITRVTTLQHDSNDSPKPLPPDLKPEIKLGGDVAAISGITLSKITQKMMFFSSCLDGSSSPKKLASHSKPRQVPQTGNWFSGSPAWTKTV